MCIIVVVVNLIKNIPMLKLRKANKNIEIMDYQNLVCYYFILNFDKSEYSADTLALVEVFKNFNPKNIEK
jgi:hypothetical protein